MKVIPLTEMDTLTWQTFCKENELMNKETFPDNGYAVLSSHEMIGYFELELMEDYQYWLKQLYIIRNEAGKLPVLLEYILLLAKEKEATVIYAHSEQPVTDLLLESMCFSLQINSNELQKRRKSGNWWSYKVS
ncbi:MAG TPA: hypothetical protein VK100_04900 [Pseudogracilibacillus sp.]|nr:hypothetical protein [Pseudogracilibacillus sp.]